MSGVERNAGALMISERRHVVRAGHHGFTLVELLVVITIIALLMGILLPSLQDAREQGKRAYCLANLHGIASAAHAYAADEPSELIIPIHKMMRTLMPPEDYWLHRTVMWFAFGGRSAPQRFLTDMGERSLDDSSDWAAATRPLNRYLFRFAVFKDGREMKMYECPSDRGYPSSPNIDDSPFENADRRCFDTIGNSYRASLYGIFPLRGTAYNGAFAIGPWGHRLSTITDASRVAVFGEPTFFNMIGLDNGVAEPDPVVATGWHKRYMTDNLAFCDGSARPTRAAGHRTVDAAVMQERANVGNSWDLVSRGPTWRFDLWPTPGARIWAADAADLMWNPPYTAQPDNRCKWWPFAGAQNNLRD